MKKLYLTLSLLMCFTSQIHARDYAIQLAASKSPQLDKFTELEEFGNLYITDAGNGFIRTRLGPFSDKQMTLEILNKVKAAGYPNAFLAIEKNAAIENSATSSTYTGSTHIMQNAPEWNSLTPEQQANVVKLDGTFQIKDGNNFIPLSEFVKR